MLDAVEPTDVARRPAKERRGKRRPRPKSEAAQKKLNRKEAPGGFEPPNGGFADLCLTTWLRRRHMRGGFATGGAAHRRAGNRTRTGDPHLGKVVLYQLSYSRVNVAVPASVGR